jgi:acyl-coenzyme A thioesterase PaaI-like protein
MMGLLPGYKKCFFCGPATGGLALELHYQEKGAFCGFVAQEKFQGFDGMLHGGIVTGILDEVMWWALVMEKQVICATSKIEVHFKKPILCGDMYRASGCLTGTTGRTYLVSGQLEDEAGHVCARSTGSFRAIGKFTMEDVVKYLDFRGVPPEIRSLFSPAKV